MLLGSRGKVHRTFGYKRILTGFISAVLKKCVFYSGRNVPEVRLCVITVYSRVTQSVLFISGPPVYVFDINTYGLPVCATFS